MSSAPATLPALAAKTQRKIKSLIASDFVRKVSQTYATQIVRIILGIVTSVAVARALGPAGRGIFGVASAIGALGAQIANLGLPVANTYFIAKDPAKLPFALGNSLLISFGFGSLFGAAVAVFLHSHPSLVPLPGLMMALAVTWIPFGLAYLFLQNLLLGVHRVLAFNAAELANRALQVAILAILLLLHWITPATAFLVMLIPLILCIVWMLVQLRRMVPSGPQLSSDFMRSNVIYGGKAYLTLLFCFVVLRGDLLLVEHFLGAEQAGYYSIASTMAENVSLLATVVGTILFPRLSAITDVAQKFQVTQNAVIGTGSLLLPLVVAAAFLARPVVLLLFGPAFLPAATAFMLLMPGIWFLGLQTVAVQMLNSMGYPVSIVVLWAITLLTNMGLNFWVIPHFGIAGAAVVSSGSYCFASICIFGLVYRRKHGSLEQVEELFAGNEI